MSDDESNPYLEFYYQERYKKGTLEQSFKAWRNTRRLRKRREVIQQLLNDEEAYSDAIKHQIDNIWNS